MQINRVSESQYESLVDLLCELNHFYNKDHVVERELVKAHLMNNLLSVDSNLCLVVAHDNERVLGLAAISFVYSLVEPAPDKCRQCQLKELYVLESQRDSGVGSALMSWVADYAVEKGCHRIDWPVKASNSRGISFYEEMGAQQVVERLSFRLTEPNLSALAAMHKV